jgi:conjugative relaxase-like TrwC/TraI family protein
MVDRVLRVSKVRSDGGAYYLEVAAGGSGTGIEAAGQWMGTGPAELDLTGVVEAVDLDAVLAGEDPSTGQVLGTHRDRVRVAGFDMTFSAPKSVSLLHALGDSDVSGAVAAGHNAAVGAAMSYVERHALAVRRGSGGAPGPVPTEVSGVAAAAFVHRMSRALDPHLHTHVVVANLGRGPEGTWSALDGRGVFAHASATDALYHAHLRHELTERLGLAWNPLDRGRADVAGIAPEARRAFSRRATQIADYLADQEWSSGRAQSVASHATRADKDPTISAEQMRPEWRRRAEAAGLSSRRLESVLDRAPRRSPEAVRPHSSPERLPAGVGQALGHLQRAVTRRDVVRAWCRSLPDGAPAPSVEMAADGLLEDLAPESGPRGRRRGPGVAERRYEVPTPELEQSRHNDRAELSRLLAGRGIGLEARRDQLPDRGLGIG